jgi:phage terminase small subunit
MAGTRSGFNAKTRQQLAVAGTLRKDRHSDLTSPEPTAGRPDAPADLPKLAQEEWDRLMWAFEDMGMLHKVDGFAVYQHCRLYAETEAVAEQQAECEASIDVLEQNIPDVTGPDLVQVFAQIVILRKLVSKCTDQLRSGRMAIRQYLTEFGLTPASRGRIKLPPKAQGVDEFESFQMKRVK